MPSGERIKTYSDFWPYYLQQHSRPQTRAIHFLGTGLDLGAHDERDEA